MCASDLRGLSIDFKYTNDLRETCGTGGYIDWTGSSGIVPIVFKHNGKWVIRIDFKVAFKGRILADGHQWYTVYDKTFKELNIHESNHLISNLACIGDIFEKAKALESIEFPFKFMAEAAALAFEGYASIKAKENYLIYNKFGYDFLGIRPW